MNSTCYEFIKYKTFSALESLTMYNLGQYIPRRSCIHNLDPRIKILGVVLLSLAILEAELPGAVLCTIFLLGLVPLTRIPPRSYLRAFKPVAPFLLLIFGLHLLFTDGTPIPPLPAWPVTVTFQGLAGGLAVTWQFALLVLGASFLTTTTSPTELVSGLERLLRPLNLIGVSSHEVALMVSVALRFVPTILEEIRTIREAQTARGAALNTGSLPKRARQVISLITPLLTQSLRRADELATAMEARGYSGGPRTYMKELRFCPRDYTALAILIILVGCLLFQQYASPGTPLPWFPGPAVSG